MGSKRKADEDVIDLCDSSDDEAPVPKPKAAAAAAAAGGVGGSPDEGIDLTKDDAVVAQPAKTVAVSTPPAAVAKSPSTEITAKKARLASASNKCLVRVTKELTRINNAKNEKFDVEVDEDDLGVWNVYLLFDKSTKFGKSLNAGRAQGRLRLRVEFGERYPFEAPFVWLVSPALVSGYIMKGGGLCMDMLSTQFWSPVTSMEALFESVYALILQNPPIYNGDGVNDRSAARHGFEAAMNVHKWGVPEAPKL